MSDSIYMSREESVVSSYGFYLDEMIKAKAEYDAVSARYFSFPEDSPELGALCAEYDVSRNNLDSCFRNFGRFFLDNMDLVRVSLNEAKK